MPSLTAITKLLRREKGINIRTRTWKWDQFRLCERKDKQIKGKTPLLLSTIKWWKWTVKTKNERESRRNGQRDIKLVEAVLTERICSLKRPGDERIQDSLKYSINKGPSKWGGLPLLAMQVLNLLAIQVFRVKTHYLFPAGIQRRERMWQTTCMVCTDLGNSDHLVEQLLH